MMSKKFWNSYLRAYDALNQLGDYNAAMNEVAERVVDAGNLRVLDAGSGTGNLSLAMKARGADVLSLDFSDVALQIHREKDPHARLLQASLEQRLPLLENDFDRIACTSVLFTLSAEGRRTALAEFARVLRPGGKLLLTVMKPRQSKLKTFFRFLRDQIALQPARLVRQMRQVVLPMLRVLYYNYLMYGLALEGRYCRLTRYDLEGAVAAAGFGSIGYYSTYGDRFHLVEAQWRL